MLMLASCTAGQPLAIEAFAAESTGSCEAAPAGNGTLSTAPDSQVDGPVFYR